MIRPGVLIIFTCASLTILPSAGSTQEKSKKTASPEKSAWLSSASLLATGIELLKDKDGRLDLALHPSLDFRPYFPTHFAPVFAPKVGLVDVNLSLLGSRNKDRDEVDEQLKRETNELLKQQLEVQKRQLAVQIEQLEIALRQTRVLGQIQDQATTAFRYQQRKDESLLRRLEYQTRANKLVVVVTDFSCGGSPEGSEVGDEIANGLQDLKKKCGLDVEILVGEIKPGVVVRNELMALDVGQHFPKGTSYAVIWGTLSPRTVGKFRPHVTCAIKVDEQGGLSRSYTIDPESQPLPLGETPEEQRRDQHRQLVAFACAVIPGCYASHEITQDRKPDMEKFLKFLEEGGPDTSKIAAEYRKELAQLTRWIDVRTPTVSNRPNYEYLLRMTPVSKEGDFPRLVMNARDRSLMTLLTEPSSDRARRFQDASGEYVLYVDVTETTNRQLVNFLNEVGNKTDGGVEWVTLDPKAHLRINDTTKKYEVGDVGQDNERPAASVSYFGAAAYCRWAGKSLPRVEEWRAAARGAERSMKYPWGNEIGEFKNRCASQLNRHDPFPTHRVESFPADASRIGCLDMAGNVSEWCEEFRPGSESDRRICGGNIGDKDPAHFEIDWETYSPQTTHHLWVGFRGVVRIRVPSQKP